MKLESPTCKQNCDGIFKTKSNFRGKKVPFLLISENIISKASYDVDVLGQIRDNNLGFLKILTNTMDPPEFNSQYSVLPFLTDSCCFFNRFVMQQILTFLVIFQDYFCKISIHTGY